MNFCKKKGFNTKKEASDRLKEILATGISKGDKTLKKEYECPFCHKWHLTAMDDKVFKQFQERWKQNEQKFIERESRYWVKKFGLDYE